jgi:hypothetical protein
VRDFNKNDVQMHITKFQIPQYFLVFLFISFFMLLTINTLAKAPQYHNSESLIYDPKVISSVKESETDLQELIDYEYYIDLITTSYFQNIKNHIENLSSFGSRVTGYPGYEYTIEYIEEFFNSQNLDNVQTLSYPHLVPMDHGTKVIIKGENYTAHALQPNSVHTSKTPTGGLSGILVYGGLGEYTELDGKKIEGSIVVLEFNSQDNWVNVVGLGAKAVIFLPPDDTNRYEAETKSIGIPLEFLRIYIDNRTSAETIRELSIQLNQSITIYSDVEWELIDAKNIMGMFPGLDDEIIIISAYFDSSSFIPAVSPGADEACGIATLLELIRIMKDTHIVPQKTIMFLALSGHNQAASGAREFVYQNYNRLNNNGGIKLFLALDLSATTNKIGINPYGYLYNFQLKFTTGNNLYRRVKSVGDLLLQYGGGIQEATTHSFNVNSYVNMQDIFENIAPISFVGDHEPFIASNVVSLSLYSAESRRIRFNTPFDIPAFLQFEDLQSQVIYSICALVQLVNDYHLSNYLDLQPRDFSLKSTVFVGFSSIIGSCKEYNETTSRVQNVANAIIRISSRNPVTGTPGIFSYLTNTDENGSFHIRGVSSSQPDNPLEFAVEAYVFDSEGKLVKANNLGSYGVFYQESKTLTTKEITVNPTVFSCGTLGLFEISHPYNQAMSDLKFQVLDPITRASQSFFGYRNFKSVSLVFLPFNLRSSIIGTFTDNVLGIYATNSSVNTLRGNGFQVKKGEFKNLGISAFITTKDLQAITQTYIDLYSSNNIYDENVDNTFQNLTAQIDDANQLMEKYEYSKAIIKIRNARILSYTALKQARNIIEDGTTTALFFALFLIPFSLALSAFLFNMNTANKWILVSSLIYSLTFGIFYLIHPSFKIAPHLGLTLIGIVNVLSSFIIIYMLFNESFVFLKSSRKRILGSHFIETSRDSAIRIALITGIHRMKKQKYHTVINLSGMALLTFSLTLFTSTSAHIGDNVLELVLPITVAILLMINTSLSTVYDSKREISIFTSLGLSPTNILVFFLTEFLVLAVIGSVIGYLGGITSIRVFSTVGLIPESFSINYSTSVVISALVFSGIGMFMGIIYPLRRSSLISVPSQKRSWKIPTVPEGDGTKWNIPLPFVASNENEVEGILAFLKEYFLIFESESVGGPFFISSKILLKNNLGKEKLLSTTINLSPFDMGIIQKVGIYSYYDKDQGHWKFIVKLVRLEGVLQTWHALVRRFIGVLRRQLLIWKDLSSEEKSISIEQFKLEIES